MAVLALLYSVMGTYFHSWANSAGVKPVAAFSLSLSPSLSSTAARPSRSQRRYMPFHLDSLLNAPTRTPNAATTTDSNDSDDEFEPLAPSSQDMHHPNASPPRTPFLRPSLAHHSSTSSSGYSDEDDSTALYYASHSRRHQRPWWSEDGRPWWRFARPRRRRRRKEGGLLGSLISCVKTVIRWRYFPSQPSTILLSLLLFSVFALVVTLSLIHILNPDKEPLPWREYCSLPPDPVTPPFLYPRPDVHRLVPNSELPVFPPADFHNYTSTGILLGVFTIDQGYERRMLVRSTWARHQNSRNGAGDGDGGVGTSRTIVRFIMGRPRSKWQRRIQLEMEEYNDIVILPIEENMNFGKTHAYFAWAAHNAWVPPPPLGAQHHLVSYLNATSTPPTPAEHDPRGPDVARPWVHPDFVLKADDDSFIMLSELEARLRMAMANATSHHVQTSTSKDSQKGVFDPMIYWGYLVKHRFMAGELYALSWKIVEWVAVDPTVKGMTRGAEDKQVAKWMGVHPQSHDIRWASEHCWIYDHPRSGTVYSHGFLFPSEVDRVQTDYKQYVQTVLSERQRFLDAGSDAGNSTLVAPHSRDSVNAKLSHSTVSTFGVRYNPPQPNLTPLHSVEALVEGSPMSLLRDAAGGADTAWKQREGRRRRYQNKHIGGTVVVHFIKRHEWFLETALALLEGEEVIEEERRREGIANK